MHRRHRLKRSADFQLLRLEGRRWHHPLVMMVARANDREISRFGISTGKRLGKATVRNRVKRLLREAVRRNIQNIDAGWDCLFIARSNATEASYSDLEAAILDLLQRSSLLKPPPNQPMTG